MNSNLIRERLNQDTKPFVFLLSDGARVPVLHPDFVAVAPAVDLVIVWDRKGKEIRIDPAHVVAIEESPQKKSKANGKH